MNSTKEENIMSGSATGEIGVSLATISSGNDARPFSFDEPLLGWF